MPDGIPGFIFPHFDFAIYKNEPINKKLSYDDSIIKLNDYNPKPSQIKNDIYFKGGPNSAKRSTIREKLTKELFPYNIIVYSKEFEDLIYIKDHKYILDLPGVKPQSVRLKYLAQMERVIIRVSFYNKAKNETAYWKQSPVDYVLVAGKDYIHLQYETDYDRPINNNLYKKIVQDIKDIYVLFEQNPNKYTRMIDSLKKKAKKICIEASYKYIANLLNSYTKNIIDMDIA